MNEQMQIDHAAYQEKVRGMTDAELGYTIRDCKAAIAAMPDGYKCGYYADEINYCVNELHRRREVKRMKLYIHKSNISISFTVATSIEEARNKIFDAKKKSWRPDGPHNTNPYWIKGYEAWRKEFESEELMEFEIENFPTALVELKDYDWMDMELHDVKK